MTDGPYITLAQIEEGEIGHNGWMFTFNWSADRELAATNRNVPVAHRAHLVSHRDGTLALEVPALRFRLIDLPDAIAAGRAHREAFDVARGYVADPAAIERALAAAIEGDAHLFRKR